MVRQISVYVDDWQYDELQNSENKSETVREALEMYFKNQKEGKKMTKITFKPEEKLGLYRGSFEVDTNDKELKEILNYVEYSDLTHVFDLERPFSKFGMLLEKGKKVTVETNKEEVKQMLTEIRFGEDVWGEIKNKIEIKKVKKERKKKAKETGKEQFYYSYSESCNEPEECNMDLVNVYIQSNGETRKERIHTY